MYLRVYVCACGKEFEKNRKTEKEIETQSDRQLKKQIEMESNIDGERGRERKRKKLL